MEQRSLSIILLIKEGQARKEIRSDISSEQLATIMMGGIRKTILDWKLSGFEADLKLEGKKLWETLELIFKK